MTTVDPPEESFPCVDCGRVECVCGELNPVSFPIDPPKVEGTEVTYDIDER